MTDDKKPRVGVMLFLGHNPLIQPQLSGTHAHLAESVPMIEKSAYDALAKENERLRKDNPDMVDIITMGKKMDFAIQERDRLKSELLNTNELSSKLVEENAALKAHAEKLAEAINRAHVGCSGEVCRSCKALADYRKEFPK